MNNILYIFLLLFITSIHAKEINLVWQSDRKNSWEEDWIMELLSGLDIKIIDDGKYEKFIDNSIVVLSENQINPTFTPYFEKLHNMDFKFGIIRLSDEWYNDPGDYYKYAKFVFRNYWNKKYLDQKNVFFFALGYKNGFWKKSDKQLANNPQRKYVWSFAGQVTRKPTREAMIAQMKKVPDYHIHEIYGWNDSRSLPVDAYQELLLQSTFIPCPTGNWNLDSFRVYEALECGCIPIVERKPIDYFSHLFGAHPFMVIDSWDEAPELINNLVKDPEKLEQRRKACYDWWLDYKKKMNEEFVRIVKANLNT